MHAKCLFLLSTGSMNMATGQTTAHNSNLTQELVLICNFIFKLDAQFLY